VRHDEAAQLSQVSPCDVVGFCCMVGHHHSFGAGDAWVRLRVYGGVLVNCPPDHLHRSGCYQKHKCKCEKCRAWVAGLHRVWAEKKRAQARANPVEYTFTDRQLEIALGAVK